MGWVENFVEATTTLSNCVIATLSLMSIIHRRQLFINISPFHLEDEQELWGSLLLGITLLTKLAQCLGRKAVGLWANFWAVATPVPTVYPIPSQYPPILQYDMREMFIWRMSRSCWVCWPPTSCRLQCILLILTSCPNPKLWNAGSVWNNFWYFQMHLFYIFVVCLGVG